MIVEKQYSYGVGGGVSMGIFTDMFSSPRKMMDMARLLKKCKLDYMVSPGILQGNTNGDEVWCPESKFEQFVLDTYGIEFITGDTPAGHYHRGIIDFKIVDEQKFLMFNLKYT